MKNAPQIIKNESISQRPQRNSNGSQSRSYSTTARRNRPKLEVPSDGEKSIPASTDYPDGGPGHKFALPDMPFPRTEHFKRRYDQVVDQLTKSLMRHGKLSVAQKVCSSYARPACRYGKNSTLYMLTDVHRTCQQYSTRYELRLRHK